MGKVRETRLQDIGFVRLQQGEAAPRGTWLRGNRATHHRTLDRAQWDTGLSRPQVWFFQVWLERLVASARISVHTLVHKLKPVTYLFMQKCISAAPGSPVRAGAFPVSPKRGAHPRRRVGVEDRAATPSPGTPGRSRREDAEARLPLPQPLGAPGGRRLESAGAGLTPGHPSQSSEKNPWGPQWSASLPGLPGARFVSASQVPGAGFFGRTCVPCPRTPLFHHSTLVRCASTLGRPIVCALITAGHL